MKAWCMFEQSGTFKNEFRKLGYDAEDLDILNDFGETDRVIDLFGEIEKAYKGGVSVFDEIQHDDIVMAFFPCVRFEDQITMSFRGEQFQARNWADEKKLEYDLKLHEELHLNYGIITKLAIIALRRSLRLIIENPMSGSHYLNRYWAIRPTITDKDRTQRGDCFKKPTQYWFINTKPKHNLVFEALPLIEKKTVLGCRGKDRTVQRSMITAEYANRFIREFIIDEKESE